MKKIIRAGLVAAFVLVFGTKSNAAPPGYWGVRPSPVVTDLHAVTFADGKYVAVGAEGTVLVSSNGNHWTAVNLPDTGRLRSVTYADGLFVAGGEEANLLCVSPDGFNWTNLLSAPDIESIAGLAHGGGRFVGVGSFFFDSGGTNRAYVVSSANGIDWQTATPEARPLRAVAFGNGQFVAVGDYGTVLTSPDGVSWSQQTPPITNDLNAVAYFQDSRFVVFGMFGYGINSTDGTNWIEAGRASFSVRGLASSDEHVVGVGRSQDTGRIQDSDDGFGWPGVNLILSNLMNSVAFSGGNWLAVGEQGIIVQAHVSQLSVVPATNGADLHLTGPAGNYRVDGSSNLLDWTSLGEFQFSGPPGNEFLMHADAPDAAAYFRATFVP